MTDILSENQDSNSCHVTILFLVRKFGYLRLSAEPHACDIFRSRKLHRSNKKFFLLGLT